MRGQGSCWWIWVQTRHPFTTHSMEATTQSNSASARRISSCQLILIVFGPWSKKGEMTLPVSLYNGMFPAMYRYCKAEVTHVFFTVLRDKLMPSTSCLMLVCSSGTMAMHFSWRPRELVSNLTLPQLEYLIIIIQSMSDHSRCSCFYRSRGRKGWWRSYWIPLPFLCSAHNGVRHLFNQAF